MALVRYILPTQPAGSVDGRVEYKNGPQFAIRNRTYPTRVRSDAHTRALNLISVLSLFWEFPLSDLQRIAWGNYAYNSPLTDAYGAPRYIKGYAHYLRSNRPRLQQGLTRIDDAPTTFGLPAYTLPQVTADFLSRTFTAIIDNTDQWANEDNAALLFWAGVSASPARTKPTETYQPAGKIDGANAGIGTDFTLPFPSRIPQRKCSLWVRTSTTLADGRLSGL